MKRFTTLLAIFMLCITALFAQAPEKFTYQAVVRLANNSLAANTQIGVRISILQGNVVGNAVYVETHIVNSNANGLITLEIGNGNVQVGSLSDIDWSDGPYFLRTETDPYGGVDYIVTSTQQMMSVPYALYAKEAGNGFSGDYNDLTNTPEIPTVPTNISAFVNDVPYLTTFTEQQVLSISNDTIFLTGGSFVKLPATSSGFSGDYNDLINKPTIPTVPTNVSAFTNDAGYITNSDIPEIPTVPTNVSAFNNDAGYLTSFTEQQVLSISNDTIFLTGGSFVKLPASFDGDYNSLTNKPEIPTIPANVSAFTNDANYITETQLNAHNYVTAADIPVQVNADWNATSGAAEILNKPTIPTNVSELTNDANYITINDVPDIPTVPTNVSAFTNDAGYITESDIPEIPAIPTNVSAFNNDAGYLTSFTEQQVLSISNDTIFLSGGSFVKLPPVAVGFSGDYNDLTNKPEIPVVPTNVSSFTNDAGYLTDYTETDPQFNAWNKDYNDLINKPAIPVVPTNVSAFTNDAGYLTSFTEQQVLTISNDTLFLTGGSYVKLPATSSGFSGDYNDLINKPTIPVVPTNVSAFNNDAGYITESDIPAMPVVPTNVSAFSNDAGYVTEQDIPAIPVVPTNVSAFNNDAGYITEQDIPEIPTVPTNVSAFTNDAGYLTSFTEQQVLTISNDTLFLTGGSYVKLPATSSGFSGDYNDLINKPAIPVVPTNVSAFNNDAGYITESDIPEMPVVPTNVSAFTNDAGYITNADIPTMPTVPTNVSAFTNDAGYLTGYTETDPQFNAWNKDYNDLINKPAIPTVPTNVSAFNNDAGYITAQDIPAAPTVPTNVSAFINDVGYITSQDIPETPTVPTNVSAFNNDARYITNTGSSCADTINLCNLLERVELLEDQLEPIKVQTEGVTAVTQTSFTVNGKVLTDGNSTVYERGFVYSTNHNPTIDNLKVINGTGLGTFTSTITGLTPGYTYFVRAYGTTQNGTFYGSEVAVTTTAITPSTLPSVTTIAVTNVTTSEAIVKGVVTSDGGEMVTQRGFVYDTLTNPTTANMVAYHGTGTGNYTNLLTSLNSGKTYYVRAFATNTMGTAYGNELSFTTSTPTPVPGDAIPCPGTPTVTDHEGNVYNTVQIGTQCWTKENMRATTSPSTGTYLIPPAGTTCSFTGKQARWYNNDSATYAPRNYGLLYNWNAAVDTFNTSFGELSVQPTLGDSAVGVTFVGHRRGICPQGWHVPSNSEWTTLLDYLNSHEEYRSGGFDRYISKALVSTIDWGTNSMVYTPGCNPSGNNVTNFTALPAGEYNGSLSNFVSINYRLGFWSSTNSSIDLAWNVKISSSSSDGPYVNNNTEVKLNGESVRCLRD